MSKTTTVASRSRNVHNNAVSDKIASHHLITWGKQRDDKRLDRDSNLMIKKQNQDGVLSETSQGVSLRTNRGSTAGINRSKTKVDKNGRNSLVYTEAGMEKLGKHNICEVTSVVPEPAEKLPIEEFYAQRGVDYRRMRKGCRIKVNGEGTSTTKSEIAVHLDCYHPPKGYTLEDLPDSQGLGIQANEDPLSPAVIIAAQPKKDRAKILSFSPDTDHDEFIKRIQNGRRCKKEKLPEDCVISNKSKNTSIAIAQPGFDDTFPENSLNDSDLIIASQQVEHDMFVLKETPTSKDVCKRDVNGNNKNSSPRIPLTSTPLPSDKSVAPVPVKDTPKTARPVTRSRNRSSGQTNHGGNLEKSVFEKAAESGVGKKSGSDDRDATPRKLLKFDGSPIRHQISLTQEDHLKVGDFIDDNEDYIFSQMELPPGEIRIPKSSVFESSSESVNSRRSTQLEENDSIGKMTMGLENTEIDSVLDQDELEAIAKLEAIQCASDSSSKTSTANTQRSLATTDPDVVNIVRKTDDTPQTRARRQGLSRVRRVVMH